MVIATLWNTVAGLIPKDTMNLIAQAQNHVGSQLDASEWPHKTVVFHSPESTIVVQRFATKVVAKGTTAFGCRDVTAPVDAVHPGMWAVDTFNQWCTALQARSTQRII
jgi:hypothetical protein